MNTLPLVIGVAAPSDPGADGPAHATVVGFFKGLARLCPHTPLRLLSCLGEPGDYRVAKIAGAVHPAPVEFVVRQAAPNGSPSPGERDARYKALAAEVARHCHLLLAVWDGEENDAADGVAELVRRKVHGATDEAKAEWSPLDAPEVGPAYLIRPGKLEGAAALCEKRFPPPPNTDPDDPVDPALERKAEVAYEAIVGCVDRFNGDVAAVLPSLEAVRVESKVSLLLEDEDGGKPPDERRRLAEDGEKGLPPAARTALGHFAAADALALHFQKKTHWVLRALFVSALLAMIVFEIYGHSIRVTYFPAPIHPWGIGTYLALWGLAAVLLWLFVRRTDYQNRRQDYRALAEALRVQFYWRTAGLDDAAEDHYLRQQRSELEWIRYALRTWNAFETVGAAGPAGDAGRVGFVARCWVRSQHQWFRKSARREQNRHDRWSRTGDGLFLLNLAGAAALFVTLLVCLGHLGFGRPLDEDELLKIEHWWVIGLALTIVVAALCIGYTERLAHAQHGKQYLTMSVLFGRAHAGLGAALSLSPPDLERAAVILREVGKEALAETADWLLMHRERPLEVPRP